MRLRLFAGAMGRHQAGLGSDRPTVEVLSRLLSEVIEGRLLVVKILHLY